MVGKDDNDLWNVSLEWIKAKNMLLLTSSELGI